MTAGHDANAAGADSAGQARFVVAVDPDRFEAVVSELRNAGMAVESTQPAIGTVVGHIPEHARRTVNEIDGVEAVEQERVFRTLE